MGFVDGVDPSCEVDSPGCGQLYLRDQLQQRFRNLLVPYGRGEYSDGRWFSSIYQRENVSATTFSGPFAQWLKAKSLAISKS